MHVRSRLASLAAAVAVGALAASAAVALPWQAADGPRSDRYREGQRVEYATEDSQKGPRAGDVRLIEG